jgi:signal transduction histidine kinase
MRLRTKFAVVLVAVTLLLSGSSLVALEVYKDDAVGESRANVEETATLAAEQIDASVRDRLDYLGLVASRPAAREFDRSGPFLEALLANSRFYAAQQVAANGTVVDFRGDVTTAQRRAVVGSDRSEAPYVRAALDGRSYVGAAESVEGRDEYVLVFAAPVFADGEVEGVLAAALYLDSQTVFDALPPLETSRQTVTVVGNGTEIHGSDREFAASVAGSATVEATGWTVTVTRDRTALDARLRRLGLFQVGLLGLVVCVMAGFGYWQYTASLRQTERLLDAFADLGAGEYGRTVSLGGGTEWEQIGAGFNDLSATLRTREAALRRRTQRLEVMYRVLRHNLRNQLSVVLTYADVVADVTDDDQVRAAARSIGDAGRTLARLSERARQVETALDPEQEPSRLEVSGMVAAVAADLREAHPDVELTTALPDEAWAVALPSLRLAVESVVENACEHNDADDPRVEVAVATGGRGAVDATDESLTADGDASRPAADERASAPAGSETGRGTVDDVGASDRQVRISVTDNGPGIPAQERAALNEGRETDLEHASGLGLWLAYWILDRSGGAIRFADASPRGTVVELVLPAAEHGPDTATD